MAGGLTEAVANMQLAGEAKQVDNTSGRSGSELLPTGSADRSTNSPRVAEGAATAGPAITVSAAGSRPVNDPVTSHTGSVSAAASLAVPPHTDIQRRNSGAHIRFSAYKVVRSQMPLRIALLDCLRSFCLSPQFEYEI